MSDDDDAEALGAESERVERLRTTAADFRSNRIGLQTAVDNLWALADELQYVGERWRDSFLEAWSGLDIALGVALDDPHTPIPVGTDWGVRQDLHEVELLIEEHSVAVARLRAMQRFPCPCCGYLVFDEAPGSHAICEICLWEDDLVQLRDPTRPGGANDVSLIEAQQVVAKANSGRRVSLGGTRSVGREDARDVDWFPADAAQHGYEVASGLLSAPPQDPTCLYWWRSTYWRSTLPVELADSDWGYSPTSHESRLRMRVARALSDGVLGPVMLDAWRRQLVVFVVDDDVDWADPLSPTVEGSSVKTLDDADLWTRLTETRPGWLNLAVYPSKTDQRAVVVVAMQQPASQRSAAIDPVFAFSGAPPGVGIDLRAG